MIINFTRQKILASKGVIAKKPLERMKGLLGRHELPQGEGLVITRCQSIHMLFMKFPIDVIFCDRRGIVVGLCPNIKPFCLSPIFLKADCAIELPSGTIAATQTSLGDTLQF